MAKYRFEHIAINSTEKKKPVEEDRFTYRIPLPAIEKQAKFVRFFEQSDKSKFELEKALSELTATYKRIIAENLG